MRTQQRSKDGVQPTWTHCYLPNNYNIAKSQVAGTLSPGLHLPSNTWEVCGGGVGGNIHRDVVSKKIKKAHKWAQLSKTRLKFVFYFFSFPSKEKVKEQFVQGYIRTCRKQERISFLPMFQGNRLHPGSHSILYTFCSSSSFWYRKAGYMDKGRTVKYLISVFPTTSMMLCSLPLI